MIIGVAPDEYEEILAAICGEGCEPDATITFADFEERLPAGPRAEIEARLTVDGVLPSLYAPPERWTETRSAAEPRWEQMVKMQAQRSGNQLRQNDILGNELNKG